jgi:hypothetical protein
MLVERLSVDLCKENPNIVFVFGDNLIAKGKAGQAVIRDSPNSFGVPTKRLPSMLKAAFFNDNPDEFEAVKNSLRELYRLSKNKQIAWPESGLGTG